MSRHIDGYTSFPFQQQGLITDGAGVVVGLHGLALVAVSSIAARNNAHLPASRLQMVNDAEHGGGFTRATHHHVAHHDHGHRQAMAGTPLQAVQRAP